MSSHSGIPPVANSTWYFYATKNHTDGSLTPDYVSIFIINPFALFFFVICPFPLQVAWFLGAIRDVVRGQLRRLRRFLRRQKRRVWKAIERNARQFYHKIAIWATNFFNFLVFTYHWIISFAFLVVQWAITVLFRPDMTSEKVLEDMLWVGGVIILGIGTGIFSWYTILHVRQNKKDKSWLRKKTDDELQAIFEGGMHTFAQASLYHDCLGLIFSIVGSCLDWSVGNKVCFSVSLCAFFWSLFCCFWDKAIVYYRIAMRSQA